jgi:hypothetical protein
MSHISGFFGKVLETTAVHLIANSAARATEQALSRSGEAINWLRSKVKPYATPPVVNTDDDTDVPPETAKKTI